MKRKSGLLLIIVFIIFIGYFEKVSSSSIIATAKGDVPFGVEIIQVINVSKKKEITQIFPLCLCYANGGFNFIFKTGEILLHLRRVQ